MSDRLDRGGDGVMRSWHWIVAGLLAPSISLAAEDAVKAMAHCAAISESGERLQCYDDLSKRIAAAVPARPVASVEVGKWITTRSRNPVSDDDTVAIELRSEARAARFGTPVTLIIRCQRGKPELSLSWGAYLGSKSTSVTTRIGGEPAETASWRSSEDNTTSFLPGDNATFIRRMIAADRLAAQVTPYSKTPISAVFETQGLETAIKSVEESCHASEPAAPNPAPAAISKDTTPSEPPQTAPRSDSN
jgi:type VI secretion system protein VasI